jgi:hypothetical protein
VEEEALDASRRAESRLLRLRRRCLLLLVVLLLASIDADDEEAAVGLLAARSVFPSSRAVGGPLVLLGVYVGGWIDGSDGAIEIDPINRSINQSICASKTHRRLTRGKHAPEAMTCSSNAEVPPGLFNDTGRFPCPCPCCFPLPPPPVVAAPAAAPPLPAIARRRLRWLGAGLAWLVLTCG